MSTVRNYICDRPNESGGQPERYFCTLALTDTAFIGASGTWSVGGTNPQKIFVAQSGKWLAADGQVILDSDSGAVEQRFVMQNADRDADVLKGNGLVGGHFVNWKKS